MLPDLKEIARKRKELGLTQNGLAKLTGVSRSWIAKVETEPQRLMPSYAQAKKVFDHLEKQEKARTVKMKLMKSLTVGEIHNAKIEYADVSERIEEAWGRMKRNCYSQLPVREDERIVGSLTERGVVGKILETDQQDLRDVKVRDAMEDPFPMINVRTPIFAIVDLLRNTQAVISFDGQKTVGIVTNTDLGKVFELT